MERESPITLERVLIALLTAALGGYGIYSTDKREDIGKTAGGAESAAHAACDEIERLRSDLVEVLYSSTPPDREGERIRQRGSAILRRPACE